MVDHVATLVTLIMVDHGKILCHLTFMFDHGQTMVISLLDHDKLWYLTMIIHGPDAGRLFLVVIT